MTGVITEVRSLSCRQIVAYTGVFPNIQYNLVDTSQYITITNECTYCGVHLGFTLEVFSAVDSLTGIVVVNRVGNPLPSLIPETGLPSEFTQNSDIISTFELSTGNNNTAVPRESSNITSMVWARLEDRRRLYTGDLVLVAAGTRLGGSVTLRGIASIFVEQN